MDHGRSDTERMAIRELHEDVRRILVILKGLEARQTGTLIDEGEILFLSPEEQDMQQGVPDCTILVDRDRETELELPLANKSHWTAPEEDEQAYVFLRGCRRLVREKLNLQQRIVELERERDEALDDLNSEQTHLRYKLDLTKKRIRELEQQQLDTINLQQRIVELERERDEARAKLFVFSDGYLNPPQATGL